MLWRSSAALVAATLAVGLAAAGGVSASASAATARAQLPATATAPDGPGGTWGPVIGTPGAVVGVFPGVTSVACAAPGDCAAVVRDTFGLGPVVMDETNGVWGKPVTGIFTVGGYGLLYASVSCPAPGECVIGGTAYDSQSRGVAFVIRQTNGTWGKAQGVPGTAGLISPSGGSILDSISCPSAGNCEAVGFAFHSGGPLTAIVVDEVNGTWENAQPAGSGNLPASLTSTQLTAVSCASAGNCSAVGFAMDSTHADVALVIDEVHGTWGPLAEVTGAAATLGMMAAISCTAPGDCAAGGNVNGGGGGAFVVDETQGTWGNAETIPGVWTLTSVACAAPGECAAAGRLAQESPVHGLETLPWVINETGGTWGTVQAFTTNLTLGSGEDASVTALSCSSPGYCTAGGSGIGSISGFLLAEENGVWGTPQLTTDARTEILSNVTSISCPANGYCTAGGYYDASSPGNPLIPFVMNEATASATTLAVSAPKSVTYGDEQAVHLAATVTSTAGGTPTGIVTVTAGGTTVCTIGLTAGTGSCSLARTAIPAGRYQLTATYNGDDTYVNSVSAAAPLTVVKASAQTALTISKATIVYGRETVEHLVVRLHGQYGTTPVGKVTIKSGKTTVCTVTLVNGQGRCTLTARQLKPGTYKLVGIYPGSADFDPSTASARILTVRR